MAAPVFGVFFTGHSYPITNVQAFQQASPTQWVLNVSSTVTPQFLDLKEVALFLTGPNLLPSNMALSLYTSVGGAAWSYRGCVHAGHPSDVFPLSWAVLADSVALVGQAGQVAQVGVSLEPLAEAVAKEGSKLGAKEDFAKMVGLNLFNYIQSFGGVQNVGLDTLLDRWFQRMSERLRRDPDFLTRQKDKF